MAAALRKPFTVTIAVMLMLTLLLSACSGGNNAAGESKETEKGSSNQSVEDAFAKGKFDPPIELTSVAKSDEQKSGFPAGESINENVHNKWALEKLGIKINYLFQPADGNNYKQKLQLMMASGEKLPDIINYYNDPVFVGQLIESGQFMSVDELYEKYAGKIYKEHAEKNPEIWYPYMKDGKKYGIPVLEYAHNNEPVLWLREDWMEKLGLQAPKTIADLENIMDKFKNQNPDGLKPSEVFPLAVTLKEGTQNTWMGMLDWVFGAYGTIQNQWNLTPDGKLEYGSVNPAAKQALAKLKEWMDKGYIHKDAALWDVVKSKDIFVSGKAGILPAPNWAPDWPLNELLTNVQGAKYKAYPIPAGPDGKIGTQADRFGVNGVVLIHKDFKHPEAFWLYYNYLLDNLADPKAGGEFENGFAEGYDYIIEDGKVIKDQEIIKSKGKWSSSLIYLTGVNNNPARIPTQYFDALIKLADGGKAETPYEKQIEQQRKPENWYAAKVVMSQEDIRKPNYFMGAPTPTMKSKWDILWQAELETFTKIIYGKVGIDEFDNFVDKWMKNGGEQVTKEVNEWYDTVK